MSNFDEFAKIVSEEQPDRRRLANLTSQLQDTLDPVQPLPSGAFVTAVLLVAFAVFCLLAAWPFGYAGFTQLSIGGRLAYCVPLLAIAALLALALDHQLVPGSKQLLSPRLLLLLVLGALCTLILLLFPHFTTANFVARGIPCLRLGTICAGVCSALLALWIARGYPISAPRTGAIAGSLAGLSGVAVLALHCPIQTAPHILLWHIGAFVIALTCGVLLGLWYARS